MFWMNWLRRRRQGATRKASDISCPVCGYYCLGRGGVGCIDKPFFYELELAERSFALQVGSDPSLS